jgi:hypothetical protein
MTTCGRVAVMTILFSPLVDGAYGLTIKIIVFLPVFGERY